MKLTSAMLTFGLLSLTATAAQAHTIHLDTKTIPAGIVLAHDGKMEPIAGVRVTGGEVVVGRGERTPMAIARTDTTATATLPRGATVALVRYTSTNSGRAPDGTRRTGSRVANPDVAEVGRSEIETIAILRSGARVSALSTSVMRLEPVGEIHNLRVGDMITLRATLRGGPLQNATIRLQSAGSETGGLTATTSPDGTVRVAIPDAGVNLFALNYADRSANDPDAHVIRRQASLSFTAHPAP